MLDGCISWPHDVAEHYRRQGYWRGEPLGSLLREAPGGPDSVALVTADRDHTYGELSDRADRLAAGLLARGLRPKDRVLVQLPNSAEFVAVCVALFRLGALPVLAIPGLRLHELAYLCTHTGARAAILPDQWQGFDYRPLARELIRTAPCVRDVLIAGDPDEFAALSDVDATPVELPPADPSNVAFFLLSGGTTNLPKLIPRTHDDYGYQIRATAAAVGLDRASCYVAALPMAHNAALGCPGVLGALKVGGRVMLAGTPSADEVFGLLDRAGDAPVVVTTLMPSLLPVWTEAAKIEGVGFPRLIVEVGGASINPDTLRDFETALGCRVTRWFGMAEGPLSFTRPHDPQDYRLASEGFPLSVDDEYLVVDADDTPCAPGEVGELLVRGPTTLRGYYREPDYNQTAFTDDGYLRTGDLASQDIEGCLTIRGRINDVVNRGGEKVPSGMVEALLAEHPRVRACAVTGAPDPLLTEKVAAFVVPNGEALSLPEVARFLLERGLAPHCVPERLVILDQLPMTQLGKVDKKALRRHFAPSTTGP